MQLGFIGGGVMAEAMINGVLEHATTRAERIVASDVNPERRALLADRYGIQVTAHNEEPLDHGEVVVVAVKPQTMPQLYEQLQGRMRPHQLLLSIAAGIPIASLAAGLGHQAIVRAMPNTPGQIGEGVTGWTATRGVESHQLDQARAILSALGREIYVDEEKYIEMITALSGGGPAYVYLFIEALIDAAVHIGLPRHIAHEAVLQTFSGSVELARHSGRHPADLRNMVTSPGGTTTEALMVMEGAGLRVTFTEAITAAYQKALALGGPQPK